LVFGCGERQLKGISTHPDGIVLWFLLKLCVRDLPRYRAESRGEAFTEQRVGNWWTKYKKCYVRVVTCFLVLLQVNQATKLKAKAGRLQEMAAELLGNAKTEKEGAAALKSAYYKTMDEYSTAVKKIDESTMKAQVSLHGRLDIKKNRINCGLQELRELTC
jgi:hypothetical protein